MMKESMSSRVIQDILTVEEQATALEASAKKKSEDILAQAEMEATAIIRAATDKEKAEGHVRLAQAQALLQEETLKDEGTSDTPLENEATLPAEVVDSIAEEVVSIVLSSRLFSHDMEHI
ncbi:hypothetical protein [Parasphaerochaeta coccoides]|uniref:Uncharacterized protein n=1 Tax=Parasphaerochaeta coccoides (strain ATCC BAA-1237 / DSM 17374 / SPN1) TaxID=760011 RepID=F4GH89_PARC1|nr:hypothetical protein [Parasphaerochaeta coccoides]AEC01988.1 hypothetical protein Spico_0763 [Parasphaerochaeta coccoides DSM 17374]